MQYAKITARVALMVADGVDADNLPDEVYATEGQVVFTPQVKRVQGAGLFRLPQPIPGVIDAQGYVTLNANRELFILDLGDPALSPSVARDQGAWKVEFKNVKFGTTSLVIDPFYINPDAADNDVPSGMLDSLGNPVQKNDLSVLAPIPTGSAGAGITRGPAGPAGTGVPDTSTAVDGQVVTYTSGGIVWATPTGGGGGGTALTSYATQVESLGDYPAAFPPDLTGITAADVGAAPTVHTHTASQVTDFTTAVDARVQNIVGAAPAALDTLVELATALGDDANFAGTVTTELAGKVPTSRTVNGKPLSADVNLTAFDVGAYSDPAGGIPSTDMTSTVQASLGKADSATQPADVPFGPRGTVLSTTVWPARPSARTDIYFDWIDAGGLGTDPPGWLDGDTVLKAAA